MATALLSLFAGETGPFALPYDALIGACAGAGAIAIVGWLGEVALKREAMGFGDVTLMAVIGAAVGPGRSLLVIFIAAAIGAVSFLGVVYPIARMRGARAAEQTELPLGTTAVELPNVPFGVFLAPAAVVALLWGEQLITWYMQRMVIS
jgi:leader peptidase (prepilin peptidase)/N-methyltransferase